MAARTITVSKFVGTISLGLLTGLSYTLSTTTLPTFLSLPTAPTCSSALTHLSNLSRFHRRLFASLPCVFLPLAYLLSPSRAKHPYLLWTSIFAGIAGWGPEAYIRYFGKKSRSQRYVEEEDAVKVGWNGEEEVNGEVIRREVEDLKRREAIRGGVSGLAFAMGVVGIWGDAY